MVLLNNGLNRIRDLFDDDVYKCQAGTGTTAAKITDTSLETADSNTLLTPTTSTASQALQITHTISTAIGNGTAYSEQQIQLESGSTSFNRIVHTALSKGSLDEYTYMTTVFFDRG